MFDIKIFSGEVIIRFLNPAVIVQGSFEDSDSVSCQSGVASTQYGCCLIDYRQAGAIGGLVPWTITIFDSRKLWTYIVETKASKRWKFLTASVLTSRSWFPPTLLDTCWDIARRWIDDNIRLLQKITLRVREFWQMPEPDYLVPEGTYSGDSVKLLVEIQGIK